MTIAPLDDPVYEPKHQPVNGQVPEVVARFGPRTQVRWFQRFRNTLWEQRDRRNPVDYSQYFAESLHHKGLCCPTCDNGEEAEYWDGPGCCCRALGSEVTA